MTDSTVRYETRGPVALIALNRPDKLNAISPAMVPELNRALDIAEGDDDIRAVVIHGNGRAFSSGFDLQDDEDWSDATAVRQALTEDFNMIMRFWDCPKPTVAAVHGYCLGGALELALACDMTVATEGCRLGAPEAKFGSGIVALLLPWVTGPKLAKEQLLTGNDRLTAQRAYEMGLINEVVPDGEHLEAALKLAGRVAVADRTSVALTKAAINRSLDAMGLRRALAQALELDILIESSETPESRQFNEILNTLGVKAALAWREARFGEH